MFFILNEFRLGNFFQIYRSERCTDTPFNITGHWRTLRNQKLNEYRRHNTEVSWLKMYERRLSLRNKEKKLGGITYFIHCRLMYLSITEEWFSVWGQNINIIYNLRFLFVHIDVSSDNKLKRHLNIYNCDGEYEPHFNRKVSYFILWV
jgi:hypothetical protein